MSRLIVKNVGPITEVDIDLKKVNVFIGPQSSGKSTLAKVISFCSWLEKNKHEMTNHKVFKDGVIKELEHFHRMEGYVGNDSQIYYQGDNITFAYNMVSIPDSELDGDSFHQEHFVDKEYVYFNFGKTVNPKVCYIPAERNFVSVVPNLQKYDEGKNNLQNFVMDWFEAKRSFRKSTPLSILDLGVKYYSEDDVDHLILPDEKDVRLANASSGLQSVTPLMVVSDWLTSGIYETEKPFSVEEMDELINLVGKVGDKKSNVNEDQKERLISRLQSFAQGKVYTHTQLIIEELEQNLYPSAQCRLLDFLVSIINHGKNHRLVLTTHSPYVLNYLNVLIHRSGEGIPQIDARDLGVYMMHDGSIQNLMMHNNDYSEWAVDATPHTEVMNDIYNEYVSLRR